MTGLEIAERNGFSKLLVHWTWERQQNCCESRKACTPGTAFERWIESRNWQNYRTWEHFTLTADKMMIRNFHLFYGNKTRRW